MKMPMLPQDKEGIRVEGEQPAVQEKKAEAPKKQTAKKKKEE